MRNISVFIFGVVLGILNAGNINFKTHEYECTLYEDTTYMVIIAAEDKVEYADMNMSSISIADTLSLEKTCMFLKRKTAIGEV